MVITDDFNDGIINSTLWTSEVGIPGATVEEAAGKLKIHLEASSQGRLTLNSTFYGDFECEVEVQSPWLDPWPTGTQRTEAGLVVYGNTIGNVASSYRYRERVGTDLENFSLITKIGSSGNVVTLPFPDITDFALKIVKLADIISVYYRNSLGDWVEHHSESFSISENEELTVFVYGESLTLSTNPYAVVFDTFRISGTFEVPDIIEDYIQGQVEIIATANIIEDYILGNVVLPSEEPNFIEAFILGNVELVPDFIEDWIEGIVELIPYCKVEGLLTHKNNPLV